jgi:hypothetical protein
LLKEIVCVGYHSNMKNLEKESLDKFILNVNTD